MKRTDHVDIRQAVIYAIRPVVKALWRLSERLLKRVERPVPKRDKTGIRIGKFMPTDETEKEPAADIKLREFRLIMQWPLVLDRSSETDPDASPSDWLKQQLGKEKEALESSQVWTPVTDILNYPAPIEPTEGDGGGYGQFAYFHDFVQKFLFPVGKNPAFSLFQRTDIQQIKTKLSADEDAPTYTAKVDRLSLHLFTIGTAIMTLELDWDMQKSDGNRLSLADAQKLIDYFRRTYTPFWFGEDSDKTKAAPQRVPHQVKLVGKTEIVSTPCSKTEATKSLSSCDNNKYDIKVFKHWRKLIAPLRLISDSGHWRDPSDERMPLNSYIALECDEEQKASALLQISENDWIRLADAEEDGDGCPYNPEYIRPIAKQQYYDRFFAGKDSKFAIRHIIDGPHYCVVGAGEFMDNIVIHHFRRHYSLLSLIARFEFTVLLAISSRLTNAVIRFEENRNETAFEKDILDIHTDFLNFTHRFRFTGVSSQLQPGEMFARWRQALQLDTLFKDIQTEIDIAFQRVTSQQQKREADAATRLNKIAIIGVVLGLIAGLMGANIFVDAKLAHLPQLSAIVGAVLLAIAGGRLFLWLKCRMARWMNKWRLGRWMNKCRMGHWMNFGVGLAFLLCGLYFLAGL